MDINFEYNDVKASEDLENVVKEKLNKLADKYEFLIKADVYFKIENTATNETGKITEIRLSAPGPTLFADSSNENFKISFANALEKIKRQVEKKKDKMYAH